MTEVIVFGNLKFYDDYKNIKKRKSLNNLSDNQKHKVENFVNQLNKLFDIADNSEVENLPSDLKLFLEECRQNDGNKCLPLLSKLNENAIVLSDQSVLQDIQDEIQDENNNIEFNLSQKLSQFSMSNEGSSQSSNQSEKRPLSDYEDELPQAKRKRKVDVMTEVLVVVLDRTKTNNQSAMHIISAVITSLGLDIDNYNISYTTIRNARLTFRKTVAGNLKDGIEETAQNLIVHWDGKLLPELSNQPMKKVERLPIVVSGMDVEQLLGVPALDESTGANELKLFLKR
ncbi:uncharacterized protein LOC123275487 [Cotesia glomerata]|uniref:uncharacterized protein LOC123275487 n=1 Tax=Cotesia glomerata TaxID=32391 RepID=UPI001D011B6D|nr:uncharacterized protein LOC123275487 [Cotesia glomerata]